MLIQQVIALFLGEVWISTELDRGLATATYQPYINVTRNTQ